MTARNANSEIKAELRVRVLELRQKGYSFRAIGRELDIDKQTASKYLQESLKELHNQEIEIISHLRQLELSRLDYFLTRLVEEVEDGNLRAIETALKIHERRAKLIGLDAPSKAEQMGGITIIVKDYKKKTDEH